MGPWVHGFMGSRVHGFTGSWVHGARAGVYGPHPTMGLWEYPHAPNHPSIHPTHPSNHPLIHPSTHPSTTRARHPDLSRSGDSQEFYLRAAPWAYDPLGVVWSRTLRSSVHPIVRAALAVVSESFRCGCHSDKDTYLLHKGYCLHSWGHGPTPPWGRGYDILILPYPYGGRVLPHRGGGVGYPP